MATAAQLSRKLKAITLPQIQELTEKVILQNQEKIKQAKVNELRRGENPDGNRIGFYRSRSYSIFKRSYNPLARGTVDLILTGAFSRGLFVRSRGNSLFSFDSTDSKTPSLIEKYGTEWQGLNDKTLREVENDYYAELLRKETINLIRR